MHSEKRYSKKNRRINIRKINRKKQICIRLAGAGIVLLVSVVLLSLLIISRGKKESEQVVKQEMKTTREFASTTNEQTTTGFQIDKLPVSLQELYNTNEDAREFVKGYFNKENVSSKIDLSEYKECKEVPLLMQWDERWGYKEYSGDVFGLTGCGPTCLSMAAIYLTGNIKFHPDFMRKLSEENGYSVEGSGTSWSFISEGAQMIGLTAKELPLSEQIMINNLTEKSIIIVVLGKGDFTQTGHFIVITGYDEEGFTVRDPNSIECSNKKWDYKTLENQIRDIWVLSTEEK